MAHVHFFLLLRNVGCERVIYQQKEGHRRHRRLPGPKTWALGERPEGISETANATYLGRCFCV